MAPGRRGMPAGMRGKRECVQPELGILFPPRRSPRSASAHPTLLFLFLLLLLLLLLAVDPDPMEAPASGQELPKDAWPGMIPKAPDPAFPEPPPPFPEQRG